MSIKVNPRSCQELFLEALDIQQRRLSPIGDPFHYAIPCWQLRGWVLRALRMNESLANTRKRVDPVE